MARAVLIGPVQRGDGADKMSRPLGVGSDFFTCRGTAETQVTPTSDAVLPQCSNQESLC